MNIWAVLLAAGKGTRLAEASGGVAKQFLEWKNAPLFWHSATTFSRIARLRGIIFVFPEADIESAKQTLAELDTGRRLGMPWHVTTGGALRQDSVRNGLAALPPECDGVLVHDAARPFMTPSLINRLIDSLEAGAKGVIPAISVTDTIKQIDEDVVVTTPDRSSLRAVQTPQAFHTATLIQTHEQSVQAGWTVTDDASLLEQAGIAVNIIEGEATNCKITNPEDLAMLTENKSTTMHPVTGWGYDVHKFGSGRPMKLGGVPIQGGPEVVAHSDGDVLLHALMDALLGLIGGGDIGEHFPDSSAEYDNASSGMLLNEVYEKVCRKGVILTNVDLTIIAQIPRLAPWKSQIHKNICRVLKLDPVQVNVKATTEEKLGFTGEKKGIKAVACVSALRPSDIRE